LVLESSFMCLKDLFTGQKKRWPFLIIFLASFFLYFQTLFFGYTGLDDSLLDQKAEIFSNLGNIKQILVSDAFFSDSKLYYRPILNVSYLFDAQVGKYQPFVFHLSNILLHAISACLVFIFLRQIFKKDKLALWLSLLFAAHPALAQAIAWIPGRNDILLLISVLASFFAARHFSKTGNIKAYFSYLVLFFIALLVKETAVFLPAILIVYWLTIGRSDRLPRDSKVMVLLGSVVIIFMWLFLRSFALSGGSGLLLVPIFRDMPSSLLMSFKVSYQAIFPLGLGVMLVTEDTNYLYSLLVWPAFSLLIMFSQQIRKEYILFGSAWFIIFYILPFLISSDAYFSHRLYLPLVGLLILLGEIKWVKNCDFQGKKLIRPIIILLFFFSLTFSFSKNFSSPLVFAKSAVWSAPSSWMAQANLGVIYLNNGDLDLSIKTLSRALSLNQQVRFVRYNLGLAYYKAGDTESAKKAWQEELVINPNYGPALSGLQAIQEK